MSINEQSDRRLITVLGGFGLLLAGFLGGYLATRGEGSSSVSLPLGKIESKQAVYFSKGFDQASLRYDPYLNGYIRDIPSMAMFPPYDTLDSFVLDPAVKPPPAGVNVRIIRADYIARARTAVGLPGIPKNVDKEQLAACIRSLVKFEEDQAIVNGNNIPTADYDKTPWQPKAASYQGNPVFIGWHDIEVSTLNGKWRFLLPDRRYSKGREVEFEKCFASRLDYHIDQKVFSDSPPWMTPADGEDFSKDTPMPLGVSVVLHKAKGAYFSRGPAFRSEEIPQDLGPYLASLHSGLINFLKKVVASSDFGSIKEDTVLAFRVVYPMGEQHAWVSPKLIRDLVSSNPSKGVKNFLDDSVYSVGFKMSGLRRGPILETTYSKAKSFTRGIDREVDRKAYMAYSR